MRHGGSKRWGSKRGWLAVWVLWLACSAWPSHAHADDWLLALATPQSAAAAAPTEPAAPGLAVLYPRRGLPALVAAGGTLVVRVRVVAALTPPPGRQQPRALSPWKASLHGHAHALGAVPAPQYPLAASRLRPDGGSSLVYRLSLQVPAWTAPGTYTLTLAGPGGERSVERGVRVLASGATPRLAWYPHGASEGQRASLSVLPVDAWMHAGVTDVVDIAAPVQQAGVLQPLLSTEQPGVVLRVGQQVLTLPACPSGRSSESAQGKQGVEDAAGSKTIRAGASIALDLGLPHRCLPAPPTRATPQSQPPQPTQPTQPTQSPITYVNLDHSTAALVALGGAGGMLALGTPRALPHDATLEIDLTLAAVAGGYRVDGGSVEFFPAGPPDTATNRLAARITRRPGTQPLAIIATTGGTTAARSPIEAHPSPPRAGAAVALSIGALPAGARVAWQLDGQPGAFGSGAWSPRVDGSGAMEVSALVVGGDGTLRREHRRLEVASARRSGCQLGAGRTCRGPPWPAVLFGLLAWRTSRRRAVAARQ